MKNSIDEKVAELSVSLGGLDFTVKYENGREETFLIPPLPLEKEQIELALLERMNKRLKMNRTHIGISKNGGWSLSEQTISETDRMAVRLWPELAEGESLKELLDYINSDS